MRTNRKWKGSVAALFGLALAGASGCQTNMAGMTLPTGSYLTHFPQYFPQDPAFPLPRELASQEDPDGAARRNGALGPAAPLAPAAPVPLPAPLPGRE